MTTRLGIFENGIGRNNFVRKLHNGTPEWKKSRIRMSNIYSIKSIDLTF